MASLAMGIDVGGSCTDVVLVDSGTVDVVACRKVPTDHRNPLQSVERAVASVVSGLGERSASEICSVSLCTTFATNALVEGAFHPAALVLIGYPDESIEEIRSKTSKLRDLAIIAVRGGHDGIGNRREALDVASMESRTLAVLDEVEAFGVSGFFSIRNPEHEIAVRDFIERHSRKPAICGFELSLMPNSVHRALTTALNASLIPLVTDMIRDVKACLARYTADASLMIVGSDGALMSSDWAMYRPIETILSGPAASALGGVYLARGMPGAMLPPDCLVMDMGGTTTDAIGVKNGSPVLLPHGAQVGDFQLVVRSVDVRTLGLGGDSHVLVSGKDDMQIGPGRATPLYKMEGECAFEETCEESRLGPVGWQQRIALHGPLAEATDEGSWRVMSQLTPGRAVLKEALCRLFDDVELMERTLRRLFLSHQADLFGFTPSDALALSGRMPAGNAAVSAEMAERLAALFGCACGADFSRKVLDRVAEKLTVLATEKILLDSGLSARWVSDRETRVLLEKTALAKAPVPLASFLTDKPVIVVGAPMAHYAEDLGRRLGVPVINPPHGEVAGAIGAVVGARHLKGSVLIKFLPDKSTHRAHLPWGVADYASLEEAIETTGRQMKKHLEKIAEKCGLEKGEIKSEATRDEIALKNGEAVYFATSIVYWMS